MDDSVSVVPQQSHQDLVVPRYENLKTEKMLSLETSQTQGQ